MRIRRPPAHLWLAALYVLTLVVWESRWPAGVLLGSVVLWRLILLRRREFREESRRALARGRHTGMMVIDLNGFEPAREWLLGLSIGSPGRTARLGAGRFAVLLPDLAAPERAYDVAGQLAASVAPRVVGGRLTPVTASIGVAVSGPGELSPDVLVHRASVAMEKARAFTPETRWAAWREAYEKEAGVAFAA